MYMRNNIGDFDAGMRHETFGDFNAVTGQIQENLMSE
jgi:hypothetical protein